ncbi:MAG: hypothetical protein ISS87_00665 [Candidatus Pacebacteria bacterium]|nr:hypothetical protein [Candidatus Paceibacterota bacterium]
MSNHKELKTIPVPQKLICSMIEAQTKWQKFSDELEDFLFFSNEQFLKKIERARKEHLKGSIRELHELKQELK